jgi:hypothetical protein
MTREGPPATISAGICERGQFSMLMIWNGRTLALECSTTKASQIYIYIYITGFFLLSQICMRALTAQSTARPLINIYQKITHNLLNIFYVVGYSC